MLNADYLSELWRDHAPALKACVRDFDLGELTFRFASRTYMMGVVNLSADSWYRESVCLSFDHAVERGRRLHLDGASLIDVGAESTLPHAAIVGAGEQKSMLLPVVETLSGEGIAVSVETYHADVAAAGLARGAKVINLTGNGEAEAIYKLVARHDAGVIICFVAGDNVREVGSYPIHDDWVQVQLDYFRTQIELATRRGVSRIWVDPGLGFYYDNLGDSTKRVHYQIQTFLNTFRLHELGWPICHALPHAFTMFREEVRTAEAFFAVLAVLGRTNLLRTHETARVRPVLEALSRWQDCAP